MTVLLSQRAWLGIGIGANWENAVSTSSYLRSLAERCRKSAHECRDHYAKEEFRRLAQEFETRADQLGYSDVAWLTKPEQARGFAGER
jgi:biotin-(acetyl-CoA carboxylase) ligase